MKLILPSFLLDIQGQELFHQPSGFDSRGGLCYMRIHFYLKLTSKFYKIFIRDVNLFCRICMFNALVTKPQYLTHWETMCILNHELRKAEGISFV